ncbi:MAG TPA: hypothetical protein VGN23_05470 [Verrucomicrobiae bacterium]
MRNVQISVGQASCLPVFRASLPETHVGIKRENNGIRLEAVVTGRQDACPTGLTRSNQIRVNPGESDQIQPLLTAMTSLRTSFDVKCHQIKAPDHENHAKQNIHLFKSYSQFFTHQKTPVFSILFFTTQSCYLSADANG